MPVYVCNPGSSATEPWRHGIQVYLFPFPIDKDEKKGNEKQEEEEGTDPSSQLSSLNFSTHAVADDSPAESKLRKINSGVAIRRVRHAEVVLADDVCVAYGRKWLRLRWPGPNGGFAGYIALGSSKEGDALVVPSTCVPAPTRPLQSLQSEVSDGVVTPQEEVTDGYLALTSPTVGNNSQDAADSSNIQCVRTGLYYPSSNALQLLAHYDDGIPQSNTGNEPVFCRICREGIHDVEMDATPAGAADDAAPEEAQANQFPLPIRRSDEEDDQAILLSDPTEPTDRTAPELPPPQFVPNTTATDNPLLRPCECSGSMAFVHYLCVEQWRCRSRHPEARNGLNCETCGAAYALPPPKTRPSPQVVNIEDDWLEAMPAHVLHALRNPHFFWQVGAAIVRRKWLRPMAPIVISPCVALYCRARRLLKKRGVSRRRWACSLCRRRARWKCVRCLRSYYCSRQCQNVSWHIVHKHVCYKPSRFWWSVALYGTLTIALCPGILKDPLTYDLSISLIPASFMVMGILGGGVATAFKKGFGMDLRGRTLECLVVLLTCWLVMISWGLVWAFFGSGQCHGVLSGSISQNSWLLYLLGKCVFEPAQRWFLLLDGLASQSYLISKHVCISPDHCFPHSSHANSKLVLDDAECASDLLLVTYLYILAGLTLVVQNIVKKRDRIRRAARHRRGWGARPHQD